MPLSHKEFIEALNELEELKETIIKLTEILNSYELQSKIIKEGNKIAILSYGSRLYECINAAEILTAKGLSTTVVDARFCKPLDTKLIRLEKLIVLN